MAKKKIMESGIYNIDLLEYFRSGNEIMLGEGEEVAPLIVDENILYYSSNTNKKEKSLAIGVKSDTFMMINGDDDIGDAESDRDKLQMNGAKEITTSFQCLKSAGLDLGNIKVIAITQDLSKSVNTGNKGFRNFENNVPQGATYSEHKVYDHNKCKYTDVIKEKSYHRAGCMLCTYKGVSYICGMDEDSYFVSKLSNHPKNVDSAFKSLKPKGVNEYEKKSSKQAQRQGEWFFIPVDMEADAMKKAKSLPLQAKGGNKHFTEWYEESNGKHYCKGDVTHSEHGTLSLGTVLHEAIQSTALGSWSVQGVD